MNSEASKPFAIELTRTAENRYVATNGKGGHIEFGRGDDLMSPVELLLAAIAGCSSIDVDTVTSRRTEPETFTVTARSEKVIEDGDASRLGPITLNFDLTFPDDEAGQRATGMIERLVKLSHDKYCTVSRTVEHGTPVTFGIDSDTRTSDDGAPDNNDE